MLLFHLLRGSTPSQFSVFALSAFSGIASLAQTVHCLPRSHKGSGTRFFERAAGEGFASRSKSIRVHLDPSFGPSACGAIVYKRVTFDFATLMDGATEIKCSEFGQNIVDHM